MRVEPSRFEDGWWSVDEGYRSLAAGLRIARRGILGPRRPVPSGRVHAAVHEADLTLCGRPVADLLEFGRRMFPFEGFGRGDRCSQCHDLVGRARSARQVSA